MKTPLPHRFIAAAALAALLPHPRAAAQSTATDTIPTDTTRTLPSPSPKEENLGEATATARRRPVSRIDGVENGFTLSRQEIFKAACCNLGESFTTNPSVDVSYSDAATGARQIRLLGLAGTYVQMLTEGIPAFRGAAQSYGLGYVPGPWMQSIQVSKGSASVKNGFESMTGQINVEFRKPQAEQAINASLYGDTKSRIEANFDGNIHITPELSTSLLAHYEDELGHQHDENSDGFTDKPAVRQYHLQNRWALVTPRRIFQAAINALGENREGGQTDHAAHHATVASTSNRRYDIGIDTRRYDAFLKQAFILNPDHGTNIALMLSGAWHDQDAAYGLRRYDVLQREGYASLLFETNFTPRHALSAGASLVHDRLTQHYRLTHSATLPLTTLRERETVPGAYAQYTFTPSQQLTLMAGLRYDHSSVSGSFVTPRFHLKYAPTHAVSFRLSAGKGFRTPHPLAQFSYLLASGRNIHIEKLSREEAWNYGLSTNFKIPLGGHVLDLSAEYYYTHFLSQTLADTDTDPTRYIIRSLASGERSFSHTMQIEATYTPVRGLSLTAAYRLNHVRQTLGGQLREAPLTPRCKALLAVSYKTPLELWQFDATLTVNGSGRLPLHYAEGTDRLTISERHPAYAGLNAQVTRWFRHWSIYVGGENITNYRQPTPILSAADPWSTRFDATQVWGPVHGAMAYGGIRIEF